MIIKIPNYALFAEGKKKLSPDETIIFAWIYKYHNPDDQFITTIDTLNTIFKFKKGNDRINKSYIRNVLVSLEEKEYIDSNLTEFTRYNELIFGTIINPEENYSGVDSSILDELLKEDLHNAKLKFYIYADVNRYKDGNKLSYSTISGKCNYFNSPKNHSVSTIQDIINQMDGTLIFRFSGERKEGSPEQDNNTYISSKYITDALRELHRTQVQIKKDKRAKFRKDNEKVRWTGFFGDLTVKELKDLLKESNWGKRDKYSNKFNTLDSYDYFAYRLAKDENVARTFVYKCDRRIEQMKDNPECPYDFDEWEREYMEEVQEYS